MEEHEQTLQLYPMLQYCMICDGQFMGQADDFCIVTHSWREQRVAPDGVNIVLADFSDWSAALSDMLFWRFQMILQCHAPHRESSD